MQAPSAFDPQSVFAHSIYHTFVITLILMGLILLLVSGLISYVIIRYRRKDDRTPAQTHGNRRLEIAWTVGPILLVTFLFVLTIRTTNASDPDKTRAPDLVVTGYQWWWHVEYPASGVITANEIHIPVGRPLLVRLYGGDVIHDFWVPQLSRKEDMVPGQPNSIWLAADHAGIYQGACAEYCGAEHAWMRIRIVAENDNDFNHWEQQQAQAAAKPTEPDAVAGSQLFNQLSCANCHAIRGTGAREYIGPDLTHLGSRQTLAAGVLENTPENLAAWLHDPDQFKPASHMPNLQLQPDQIRALTAYLETLR